MSREFNVNVLDCRSNSPLNNLVSSCQCHGSGTRRYTDEAIRLLLANKANVNLQNCLGITPLMSAASKGCLHIVEILLHSNENGEIQLNTDTQDMYGETALMKASREQNLGVIKLLVENGASANLRDSRGFTALHSAIYRGSDIGFSNQKFGGDDAGKEIEVLILLLEACPDAKNITDFCGNTMLDLWMKYAPNIKPETIDVFIKRGCTFSALSGMEEVAIHMKEQLLFCFEPANRETMHILQKLRSIRSCSYFQSLSGLKIEKVTPIIYKMSSLIGTPFLIHMNINDFLRMLESETDVNRTVLHYQVIAEFYSNSDERILEYLITSGCDVNALDAHGRSPLHYATSAHRYDWLLKKGANENQKDKYGFSAKDICQLRLQSRIEWSEYMKKLIQYTHRQTYHLERAVMEQRTNRRRLYLTSVHASKRKLECDLDAEQSSCSHVWRIWKENEFAFRHPAYALLTDEVTKFVDKLTECMKSRDPRFECKSILVGSSVVETKIDRPDEYDFNLILTKLSEVCKVDETQSASKGLVHLKKETNPKRQTESGSNENFNELFNKDGYLLCGEVMSRFKILFCQALAISRHHLFEWNERKILGYPSSKDQSHQSLCITISLRMIQPFDGLLLDEINIDIVPCIHVDGWWPKTAVNDVDEELKKVGCNLVFDQPKETDNDPSFAVPNPHVRISFAILESVVLKQCSVALKAAFMVIKHLMSELDEVSKYLVGPRGNYILKTSLLYCNEVLQRTAWRSELQSYDDITEEDLEFAVRKLMWCYLEFYKYGFYPGYIMPYPNIIGCGQFIKSDLYGIVYVISMLKVVNRYLLLCQRETEAEFNVQLNFSVKTSTGNHFWRNFLWFSERATHHYRLLYFMTPGVIQLESSTCCSCCRALLSLLHLNM